MKFTGTILKIIGLGCLLIMVLPAVVSFLIPVMSVGLIIVGCIACIIFALKLILGR